MTHIYIYITILVSLGPSCHTAGILKYLKYKNESYHFDWMLTNINIVNSIILNNFEDFKNITPFSVNFGTLFYNKKVFI